MMLKMLIIMMIMIMTIMVDDNYDDFDHLQSPHHHWQSSCESSSGKTRGTLCIQCGLCRTDKGYDDDGDDDYDGHHHYHGGKDKNCTDNPVKPQWIISMTSSIVDVVLIKIVMMMMIVMMSMMMMITIIIIIIIIIAVTSFISSRISLSVGFRPIARIAQPSSL